MTLTGVGCRLQTCSRLASERFDSAFCALPFVLEKTYFTRLMGLSPQELFLIHGLYAKKVPALGTAGESKQIPAPGLKQAAFCLTKEARH